MDGKPNRWRELLASMHFTSSSGYMLSAFALLALVIGYVWWPLAKTYFSYVAAGEDVWARMDWLLIGIFSFISLLIMLGADLRKDAVLFVVGLAGGLVIEGWGTQTQIWTYFTQERPPLWIIPAWGLANLSIFRLVKFESALFPQENPRLYRWLYWIIFTVFLAMMYHFVSPTLDKSFTVLALIGVTFIMLTPTNYRLAVLIFIAGTGLGYFFERWGTTRHCWNYYTGQTPPPFSVVAHGLAAVAFWRAERYLRMIANMIMARPAKVSDREIWG
jgi:hypothetical protein